MFPFKPKPFRPTEPVIGWRLGRRARQVLLLLEIKEDDGYARKSRPQLAAETGMHERNLHLVLEELIAMGYIRKVETGHGGTRRKDGIVSGKGNRYEITYVPKKHADKKPSLGEI